MGLNYRNTRASLEQELKRLAVVRERISRMLERVDKRMNAVSAAAETLASAYESKSDEVASFPGLSDEAKPAEFEVTASIRDVMQSGRDFTVPQIRDLLISRGWKTENYKNPLASIHTVLKRRVQAGEVEIGVNQDGAKCYFDLQGRAEMAKRDRESRAMLQETNRANAAAFTEFKSMVETQCLQILGSNPKGITAKALYRELSSNADIEVPSHWNNPVVGITRVLQGMPRAERFRAARNDVVQTFWRLKRGT